MTDYKDKKLAEFDEIVYHESVYGNPNWTDEGWVKCKEFISELINEVEKNVREEMKNRIDESISELKDIATRLRGKHYHEGIMDGIKICTERLDSPTKST